MKTCRRCVLPETYPGIEFDPDGVCNFCLHPGAKEKPGGGENKTAAHHFKDEQELIASLEKYKNLKGKYDVLLPLSGGVDSCNALITVVEKYKLKTLAFHNDHGYEDEIAATNARNLCALLGVDLVIMQQDLRFMKKLWKYINESDEGLSGCYVCGNILYLNALEIAAKFAVPLVINGYSKGQAAMVNDKEQGSSLLEKVIEVVNRTGDKEFFNEFIGKYKLVDKKIAYEKKEDLEKEVDPDKILVIPFYVFDFYKTDKEELKEKLCRRFDWQPLQTSYPSRTTNCEMVWLCSYMDRKKMGYSMYEIEYSELIRRGEFTREQACRDLEFNPPPGLLQRLAAEVGVDLNRFDQPAKPPAHKSQVKKQEIDFDL